MNISTNKQRLSNVELLRILAMFGVLIVHTDFGALHNPESAELISSPVYGLSRIFIEAFALVSVNVFVLISGWFGITFKWRGIANLLFQTLFFFFSIYASLLIFSPQLVEGGGLSNVYKCLMLSDNAWFVKAYLGMYILAPAINAMIKYMPRTKVKAVIISFFVFQTIYGWISNGASWILMGYSTFSFVGLYLLARYMRTYRPSCATRKRSFDMTMYVLCSLITGIAMTFLVWLNSPQWNKFMEYTSPLLIIASWYLLLFFVKTPFISKAVNWIAASCFAVYLMHFMIFPKVMRPTIQAIAIEYSGITMFILLAALLIAFFSVAILVDKVRLYIWARFISPHFND